MTHQARHLWSMDPQGSEKTLFFYIGVLLLYIFTDNWSCSWSNVSNLINKKPFLYLVLKDCLLADLVELKFVKKHVFGHLKRPLQSPATLIVVQHRLHTVLS